MSNDFLNKYRVVPVVVIKTIEDTIPTLKALCEGGLPVAEITFRTACAAEAIALGVKEFPDMHIGAGTVINGEQAKALENTLKYLNLMNDLFIEVNPIPVKAAMNMMGLNAGPMRLPLCEMSPEHQATLRKTMEEAGLV